MFAIVYVNLGKLVGIYCQGFEIVEVHSDVGVYYSHMVYITEREYNEYMK